MKRRLLILTLCLSLFGTIMAQQRTFAPQGAEWYFQVDYSSVPITQPSFGYLAYAVTGEAEIQGHVCSVINNQHYVYEENKVVYWYNQVNDAFTVLYDFNAETGDTWYCDVAECTCLVTVTGVGSVIWNGHTYRTQYVEAWGDGSMPFFDGRIFEGIGYEKGLFPDEMACYDCVDCDYISYMRCYLEDGEMLYHEGDYDCDYIPGVTGNCWDGTIADSYAGGNGTEENPYRISNGKQLALLAYETNNGTSGDAYYKLTANINLEKCSGGYNVWTSIGTPEHPFTGHFDGNENYVLNLYQCQNTAYKGLFGYTDGAKISNVEMALCEIGFESEYAGALVGYANQTDICNCHVGDQSHVYSKYGIVGGIVGSLVNGIIHISSNHAQVQTKIQSDENASVAAGGIVGNLMNGVISDSYNLGSVTGLLEETGKSVLNIGGIVGVSTGSVHNVYNAASVSSASDQNCGEIVGYDTESSHFLNCYWKQNNSGLPACGNPDLPTLPCSTSFIKDTSTLNWGILNEPQYGTSVLIDALNMGSSNDCIWRIEYHYPQPTYQAPIGFAPQGAEWYFNRSSFMGSPISYYHMEVLGDTVIQGHHCSIITPQFLGGNGNEQFVYEQDRKVYWFNQTLQAFTTLYDFNAEAGDSWICEIDSCAYQVTVTEITNFTWEDTDFRVQQVTYDGELGYYGGGTIIDGIGEISGLFPYPYACSYSIYDGPYPDYLRCYLVNGEMLYHSGVYDCEEMGYCWDGTIADSYAGGNGTAENPYQIATSEQLALLAQQTNDGTGGDAYYVLTQNVSLKNCSGGNIQWIPIGNHIHDKNDNIHYFTGHFDGGGHTIYGLYQNIDNGLDYFGGLFGCTDGAEIKNIRMHQCSINGIGGYIGSVVGFASRTDVLNCTAYDSYIRTTGSYTYAGGIVGYAGTPIGVSQIDEPVFRISNCKIQTVIVESSLYAGGIVGCVNDDSDNADYLISNCSTNNVEYFHIKGMRVGGIVGGMNFCTVEGCVSKTIVYGTGTGYGGTLCVGGIAGNILSCGVISNSYNRGDVVTDYGYAGGIVGFSMGDVHNVYNTGEITSEESGSYLGNIVGFIQATGPHSCYWLENGLPGEGYPGAPNTIMTGSTSFHQGATPKTWVLDEEQYGTTDLLEALNLGPHDNYLWLEDTNNTNDGYPICVDIEPNLPIFGSEWYYEILNDDGSITYQYLQHSGDTTIQDEPVQIIVKINTLYDKGEHIEKSYEYIFERDGKIYWWNKTLEEFTVLYDYNAQVGDEWEIKVGTQSLVMHVDTVEIYEYEGRQYKILQVSDDGDLFSGTIVCGIGHLTSFFPERLLSKGYRVEGIRCFWQDGELVFKYGEKECDEVYEEFHDYSVDDLNGSEEFSIFPNPTDGMITISGRQTGEYRITNLMGQTLMTGQIESENQQINISALSDGMFFITFAGSTRKFIKH